MAIQTFLAILSIGLSMVITIPDFSKIDDGAYRVASIVNEAIRQYPTVGRVLFPAGGTLESQQYQVAELSSMLRKQEISISDTLEAGLALVMSDPEAFKTFTSSRAFAVDFGNWTNLKCPDYDINGQCNRWWYSARQNTTYTLGNGKLENPSEMLATIFAKGWTTPQLLFENAAACSVGNWLNTNKLEPIDLRIDGSRIITDTRMGALATALIPMLGEVAISSISSFLKTFFVSQEKAPYNVVQWESVMNFVVELQLGDTPESLSVPFEAGLRDLIPGNSTLEHLSHPPETFYNISGVGMDFSCISQSNVSVMTSWYNVYHGYIV
ncbi:MAG: hypothetical protein Q9172_001448 [Xanthocarpia lactea]